MSNTAASPRPIGLPQTIENLLQSIERLAYLDEVLAACSGGRPPAGRDAREAYDFVVRSPEWKSLLQRMSS